MAVGSGGTDGSREIETFILQLGAAMSGSGQPADVVQDRLVAVARSHGRGAARVNVYPTSLMVTMGRGEPATLEL